MNDKKILACIDPRGNTDAVIDWAAWAALRLAAPLEFLHVLERHPERADSADLSGAIGLGVQEALLQQLSDDDARRSLLQRESGRELLAHARSRAGAAGVTQLDARLRHGDLVETAIELQAEASLFVLGEHRHSGAAVARGAEHHLEQVIRGVAGSSVLVASTEHFAAPQRSVLAFDGSPRSLSDLGSVGCESTAAVHFSPSFCPITGLWGCKSGKNCPRWGRFSLSTPQARQTPSRRAPARSIERWHRQSEAVIS